jgi:hypothetical protein
MDQLMFCPSCRLQQPIDHTYCARCGLELPRHLFEESPTESKSSRFFPGVKVHQRDPEAGFLRVSCYRKEQSFEAPEGEVTFTGRHVRFSIWDGERVTCVLSVPETEARALAAFITADMDRLQSDHATPA